MNLKLNKNNYNLKLNKVCLLWTKLWWRMYANFLMEEIMQCMFLYHNGLCCGHYGLFCSHKTHDVTLSSCCQWFRHRNEVRCSHCTKSHSWNGTNLTHLWMWYDREGVGKNRMCCILIVSYLFVSYHFLIKLFPLHHIVTCFNNSNMLLSKICWWFYIINII